MNTNANQTAGRDSEKAQRIVGAALAVFNRHGFHKATMQDIAAEAGVGKGTTYLYFDSKDQLLEHIFEKALGVYMARVREAAAAPGTAPERIRRLVESILDTAQMRNGLFLRFVLRIRIGLQGELKRRLLSIHRQLLDEIAAIVAKGVADGELKPVDPLVAAHVISGTLSSLTASLLWPSESLPAAGEEPRRRAEVLAAEVMRVLALGNNDG